MALPVAEPIVIDDAQGVSVQRGRSLYPRALADALLHVKAYRGRVLASQVWSPGEAPFLVAGYAAKLRRRPYAPRSEGARAHSVVAAARPGLTHLGR